MCALEKLLSYILLNLDKLNKCVRTEEQLTGLPDYLQVRKGDNIDGN